MKTLIALTNKFHAYLIVGVMNTLLCFMVMYLGALLGLNYLEYTGLGYVIAILFSFFMNLRYTFQVEGNTLRRLILFLCINLINLLLVELIEHVLIESVELNKLFAIFTGMGWYIFSGFLLNNFLVYRQPSTANS